MEEDEVETLVWLEEQRCAAISNGDLKALGELLGDDITHTHITGKTQNRDGYLAGLDGRPRETSRADDLRVRVFGDAAVMTGTLRNTFPPSEPGGSPRIVEIHALQVWAKQGGVWRQVAFASSGQRQP